jgi:dTMP kinase
VANVIAPAVQAGTVVVAERCYLSTVVYQGLATDRAPGTSLDAAWLLDLTRRVHGAMLPDTVFVLDVPSIVANARRRSRTADRIEARGADYHERVRQGFLQASACEVRAVVVDAAWPFASVQASLRSHVARRLA